MQIVMMLVVLAAPPEVTSGPLPDKDIPPALREWLPWVAGAYPTDACLPTNPEAQELDTERQCLVFGQLVLTIREHGAEFLLDGLNEARSPQPVVLPGNPRESALVLADGTKPLVGDEGAWYTLVPPGAFILKGELAWQMAPSALAIPLQVPVLDITYQGHAIYPTSDNPGMVTLAAPEETKPAAEEAVVQPPHIVVRRLIVLDRPVKVVHSYVFTCAARDQDIAFTLPEAFLLEQVQTRAPIFPSEQKATFRYRCPIGRSTVTLEGRLMLGKAEMEVPPRSQGDAVWEDEVWVFSPDPLRWQSEAKGGDQIEASLVQELPSGWVSSLSSAWRLPPAGTLRWTLTPIHRGQADKGRLTLSRSVFMTDDRQGRSYVHDHIQVESGELGQLALVQPTFDLAGLSVQDVPWLILKDDHGRPTMQLRQRATAFKAAMWWRDGLPSWRPAVATIPAGGWSEPFQSGSVEMRLLPGFVPIAAWGAEERLGDLWQELTLYDLLLAVLSFVVAFLAARQLPGQARPFMKWLVALLAALVTLFAPWMGLFFSVAVWITLLALFMVFNILRSLSPAFPRMRCYGCVTVAIVSAPFALALIADWPQTIRSALHPNLPFAESYRELDRSRKEALLGGDSDKFATLTMPSPSSPSEAPAEEKPMPKERSKDERRKDVARKFEKLLSTDEGGNLLGSGGGGNLGQAIGTMGEGTAKAGQAALVAGSPEKTQFQRKLIKPIGISRPGVATGRGLSWSYQSPLPTDEGLSVIIVPPVWRGIGIVLHVLAVLLAALLMLGARLSWLRRSAPVAAALCMASLAIPSTLSAAELPTKDWLDELRARRAEQTCRGDCVRLQGLTITMTTADEFTMEVKVSCAVRRLVQLPGPWHTWRYRRITIDGKPAQGVRREAVELLVEAGTHRLRLQGSFVPDESPRLIVPVALTGVAFSSGRWALDVEAGPEKAVEAGQVLSLIRQAAATDREPKKEEPDQAAQSLPLATRIEVQRRIEVSEQRQMTTSIEARGLRTGEAIDIPLLPGENVIELASQVRDGFLRLTASGSTLSQSYTSTLAVEGPIKLEAAKQPKVIETWEVLCDYANACLPSKPPKPISSPMPLTYEPEPGEALTIEVHKLAAAEGNVSEGADWKREVAPGTSATTYKLSGAVRYATSTNFELTLPADAKVVKFLVNDHDHPARPDHDGKLSVQVGQGRTEFSLEYTVAAGMETSFMSAPLATSVPLVNLKTTLTLPGDRVVLATLGGTIHGPMVLFWSLLGAHLLIALLIFWFARRFLPELPHRVYHWLLLLLPLASLSTVFVPFLVLPLFVLAVSFAPKVKPRFGVIVLYVLALLTVTGAILVAAGQALLNEPEMHLVNSLDAFPSLTWLEGVVPLQGLMTAVGVFSVPLWAWKVLQFVWCLWLLWLVRLWAPFIQRQLKRCLTTAAPPSTESRPTAPPSDPGTVAPA